MSLRVLAGLVSTILTCLIVILFYDLTGIMINTFSLLFIAPIGAAFAGAGCASGYYYLLKKFPLNDDINQLLFPVLLALIGFIGVYYGIYKETFIVDGNINYLFKGEHISNFTYEGSDKAINFWSFLNESVTNSSSIIRAGRIPVSGVDLGGTFYWVKFYLQILGYIIGGLFVGFMVYTDMKALKVKTKTPEGARSSM